MTKRSSPMFLFGAACVGMLWASPSRADYVLLWSSAVQFVGENGQSVPPFPQSFLGDVDQDGQEELVGLSDHRHVVIRDAMTGTVEAQIEVPDFICGVVPVSWT